ncbi:MAG: iron-containing alcohol dehydrogenase [Desulfobacterales bacterium]|nr:MAG: iron-containing alcohol dehydrogenase [Desulfobacterales bacterium]
MTKDYGGVVNELVAGEWKHPQTGQSVPINIRSIVIKETLAGMEGDLIAPLHKNEKLGVVSDRYTYEVLGRRISSALRSEGFAVEEIVWKKPHADNERAAELRHLTRHCEGLIAVGSGTINDSVKYAAFLDQKHYSVFPTSPQLAYSTATASISFGGFKKSIIARPAQGVFFDLSVVSQCPIRLTRSAFADVICRTTAQVDWLMSHLLFGSPYHEAPYILLAYDEDRLFDNAKALQEGDFDAFGMLVRTCVIMGLGTCFTNTTHSGSMGEHMMSHYIDMFFNDVNPNTLHGEQVGVASLTMSRLQNRILRAKNPPSLAPTQIDEAGMYQRYGNKIGPQCIKELKRKALDQEKADKVNRHLKKNWENFAAQLRAVMLPTARLLTAMQEIGAPRTGRDLGFPQSFYREIVLHSREVRDRFTMLDLAADSGMLEGFADECR